MKLLLLIAYLVLLLVVGTYCVFFPSRVQQWAARSIRTGLSTNIPFLKSLVDSRNFLFTGRAVGLIAYVAFLLLAVAAYRGHE
jgi:hypothetical protein